jgi:hypothetical protein
MNYNFKTNLVLSLAITFLFSSCASQRTSGFLNSSDKISLSKGETKVLKSQALALWNKRHVKISLEESISAYKKLARSTNDNYEYLSRLSRAHYFLADAHYDDMETKKKYWEMGTSYGEKAMATNEKFKKAMEKDGAKVEDHLGLLGMSEISALYWTAANLGKWAKNSGIVTTLKYKTLIKSLILKVETLDRKFFYYAADRYWGAFFAIAPGFAGGDMNKSRERFLRNIKEAPTYLGTKVLFADYYMVKQEDKKEFKKLLNEVINSKVNDPVIFSENFIEKLKAKKLLKNIDEIF